MADRHKQFREIVEKVIEAAKDKREEELLLTFEGVLYPALLCSPDTFQALRNFEARVEDIILVAYPKCGFNWVLQVLYDITSNIRKEVLEDNTSHTLPLLELGAPEKYQEMTKQPSPRIFGTHFPYDLLPSSIVKSKTKMLVVFRNPKDAAVSYFHFYNNNPMLPTFASWDEFFSRFMTGQVCWGSYFDSALSWDKHIDDENVLIITYEQMKENTCDGVKQIAEFFDASLSEDQIKSIAVGTSFQSMKAKSSETHGSLGNVLFRKGGIGDWKNHFTEAQSKEMDVKFEECLAGTKLGALLKMCLL
nr:PREDICTED: sulfotransferase 6B1-like isoform X2 [Latimeria chalumnae]|eukprot:XP_014345163.1 PREDICTED: sulfotransferase 6B1-like isoform X2 [Latimeria chalumnae]